MALKLLKRGGSSCWYIRGTANGRAIFKSTKTSDRAIALKLRRRIEEQAFGLFEYKFSDAAASYVKYGGEARYLAPLIAALGRRPLTSITQDDLDAAAERLLPGTVAATKNRQVYTPFIAVWNRASLNRWVLPWKWERPRKPKGTAVRSTSTRSGTKPVPYEKAWQFVSAMSPGPAMVMTTLFYTGMRPIELFALTCDDVNVAGRWITVQASKTGPGRGVPMHEVLAPLLTSLKGRGAKALFLGRHGKPYPITDDEHKGQLSGAIQGARGRLKRVRGTVIDDVSPYTARHTVSTQLVLAGVHPHVKDQILGHAADDMSRHYTNIPQKPLIEAINLLPVIPEWRDAEWMVDPLVWTGKLVRWENHGRRGAPKMEDA